MAMAKTGETAKDICASTAETSQGDKTRGPGRPPVHRETWTKTTVVLFDRQILYLDRLALDIRAKTGTATNRTAIIRALIDGLEESGLDLLGVTSEAEMKALVAGRLSG